MLEFCENNIPDQKDIFGEMSKMRSFSQKNNFPLRNMVFGNKIKITGISSHVAVLAVLVVLSNVVEGPKSLGWIKYRSANQMAQDKKRFATKACMFGWKLSAQRSHIESHNSFQTPRKRISEKFAEFFCKKSHHAKFSQTLMVETIQWLFVDEEWMH